MSWLSALKSTYLLGLLDDFSVHPETRVLAQRELDFRADSDLQEILDEGVDS